MPLLKRCCICGRIADRPHSAIPYRNGWCCDECYVKHVVTSKERIRKKYAHKETFD